eukprot:CAMPEP_0182447258 /NCGR_PEP_ID=MMETSP1172-20130603/13580_1 /TAXON_ID=708627 /ORGANISM="Timspurckia oligopyrenoides, Strain CCMP3278" /LENGTH=257 /DNA_ID=CAMNT_0024643635 /DNA_START=962 /DNA_END=1732 /DNA_ORIENTATION=+
MWRDVFVRDLSGSLLRNRSFRRIVFGDASGETLRAVLFVLLSPIAHLIEADINAHIRRSALLSKETSNKWISELSPNDVYKSRLLQLFAVRSGNDSEFSARIQHNAQISQTPVFSDAFGIDYGAQGIAGLIEASQIEDEYGLLVQRWLHVCLALLLTGQIVARQFLHELRAELARDWTSSLTQYKSRKSVVRFDLGTELCDAEVIAGTLAVDTLTICTQRVVDSFQDYFVLYLNDKEPQWPSELNHVLRTLLKANTT